MLNSDFGIELDGYEVPKIAKAQVYRVHAVPIGLEGKMNTIDICADFLDDGNKKNQNQWAQFSRKSLIEEGFHYLSIPQLRGLVHVLRINKDNPKEEESIRKITWFLKEKLLYEGFNGGGY